MTQLLVAKSPLLKKKKEEEKKKSGVGVKLHVDQNKHYNTPV